MELTIHNFPSDVHQTLLARAATLHQSLENVALDAIVAGMGVMGASSEKSQKYGELADLAGSGGIDEEIEAALWDQRRIDPELWQ